MEIDRTDRMEINPESSPQVEALPSPPQKAGFWRRAVAYLLDLAMVEVVVVFFILVQKTAMDLATGGSTDLGWLVPSGMRSAMSLWIALFSLYFTFFTYWGGQTPGKMMMRVRVVTLDDEEISLGRAMMRTLCYFLSYLLLGLGFTIVAITRNKRALHDYLAGTRVVVIRSSS